MRRALIYFCFSFIFLLGGAHSVSAACGDSITGGSGTIGSPYLISTPTELAAISNCLGAGNASKYFKLDANIDLNVSPYNTGTGWTPIGVSSGGSYFYGKFDGDFKTISNLYYNSSGTNYVGLFGYVGSGATISNLLLDSAVVSGNLGVGVLAGSNSGAISKVGVVGGSVTGIQRTGGLVGSNYGSITQTYSNNTVYFNPTSSPTCCAGGLTGEAYSGGTINNSYSRSNIIMTYNAYNQGAIGGLYGNDYSSSTKTILYSTGSITMVSGSFPSSVGGLAGSSYTNTTSSYWDTETSGRATSGGGAGVVGKTTSQMKTQGTYSGWDFSTIWAIDGVNNDGYPYLLWQDYADTTNPTIDTLSPTDGETGTNPTTSLVITFDEIVDIETGNITIYNTSDDSVFEIIDVSQVTGSGTTVLTISPTTSLEELTGYYVQIDATAFDDVSGNSFAGISDTTTWNFVTGDVSNPSIINLTPADDGTEISPLVELTITFNENVNVATGNIYIYDASDDSLFETIDIESASVTGFGTDTITIILSEELADLTPYYVQIDSGVVEDSSGNSFAGISDTTTWNFTTNDINPSEITSLSPADNASGVAVDSNLVITFNEPVFVGESDVTLYYTANDEYLYGFPVNGGAVSGSGTTTITINPGNDLEAGRNYYILIDANAFEDSSGNVFPEITSTTTWNFSTVSSGSGKVAPNPGSVTLDEDAERQVISLILDQPIIVSEGDPAVTISISSDDSRVSVSPDTITFLDSEWQDLKEFTVITTGDFVDNIDNDVTITLSVTSDSEYYDGYENTISVTLIDDDIAGIDAPIPIQSLTEHATSPIVDVLRFTLESRPLGLVMITPSSVNGYTEFDAPFIIFTPMSWSAPQSITSIPINDAVANGTYSDTITFTVTSADTNYSGYLLDDVPVTIIDDDQFLEEESSHSTTTGTTAIARARFITKNQDNPVVLEKLDTHIFTFKTLLKRGLIHEDVKMLQIFLNTYGFPLAQTGPGSLGNETNYFGERTKNAVMLFQKAVGLVPDGIIGPKTILGINSFTINH